MSLDELLNVPVVVEGASRYKQQARTVPASITVITAEQIRLGGYQNLSEILDTIPGIYNTYDRNYYYTGVRGFRRPGDYDSRILVLINGIRINDNLADSAATGWELPVDIDLVDRIEVIKGPGSSIYGSNALLAVVNIITKSGREDIGTEIQGQVGDGKAVRGRMTFGKDLGNDRHVLISASGLDSPGSELYFSEFDSPSTGYGLVDNDEIGLTSLFLHAGRGPFSLTIAHCDYRKGIPSAPWETVFGDSRTRTQDSRTVLGVAYSKSVTEKTLVEARADYQAYDYDGWYPTDWAGPGEPAQIVVNRDRWEGRWCDGDLQLVSMPTSNQTVTCGIEGRYNIKQLQRNWDQEVYLDDRRDSWHYGLYIQDQIDLTGRWVGIAGMRYDHYSTFGSSTNPRLAIIGQLSEETTMKLLYGRAFRAPNAYELYYQDGYTMKAALNLRPELITTYELVLEQALTKGLNATCSLYTYRMRDIIDQYIDPADGMMVFGNLGSAKAKGIELTVEGNTKAGTRIRAGYSFTEATNGLTDELLVNCPIHMVKFNAIVPFIEQRCFASITARYRGKVKTLSGNWTNEYLVLDTFLTYRNSKGTFELGIGIKNLFDVRYGFPGGSEHAQDILYQDGRQVMARAIYRIR